MSNFHLAHFSPEELHTLIKASGDGTLPGTNVVHLKNLEHMMKNPHVKKEIIHTFHDMVSKGYHPNFDDMSKHHKQVIKKTGGHPALVGEHTGHLFNHLMGGGQPEAEPRRHYFLGKLIGAVKHTVGKVARGAGNVVKGVAGTARKVVGTATKVAGKVSGVSNIVRKVHPGAANALDKGASAVQKGADTVNGMVDKGEGMANNAIDKGQNMANGAIDKGQAMIPGAAPAPMPQPQPMAAKRGGRLHLAQQFMRRRHAEGEEIEREHHGLGKIVGKVAKAGLNAAAKVSPTARAVKAGIGTAKKFAGSKAGKAVLKGAKAVASNVKEKRQENKAAESSAPAQESSQPEQEAA